MGWETVIGLEIHAELKTKSKLFCGCRNDPDEAHPNINVCPVCLAHPGTLPVLNEEAVRKMLLVGLALNCEVNLQSHFDRKNYFYPDLPKGYQISQYECPINKGGWLELPSGKNVRITRVHLEEDTGSLVHDTDGSSLVDFNRAGIPLMELVTEPDLRSAGEAREFAQELQLILRYLGVSGARMEKGEMRVEANVSVRREGDDLGTKVELKNINSFRFVERAVEYEVGRQIEVLKSGGEIKQETRGWDEIKNVTKEQRSKEEAHDYRYFPEPDLPPVDVTKMLEEVKAEMVELPAQKRERFLSEYMLDDEAVSVFVQDKELADYYEQAVSELDEWAKTGKLTGVNDLRKTLRNYILTDALPIIRKKGIPLGELLMTPENFAELIKMFAKNEISSRGAKDILLMMIESGGDPFEIAREYNFLQTSDEGALGKAIEGVKKRNEKAYKDYVNGNDNTLQFLIGQTMREARGMGMSPNPSTLAQLWRKERGKL